MHMVCDAVLAGMAVFDTMRYVKSDVSTVCVGLAASMGAFILASGHKVQRCAMPCSAVLCCLPSCVLCCAVLSVLSCDMLCCLLLRGTLCCQHTCLCYALLQCDVVSCAVLHTEIVWTNIAADSQSYL